MATELPSMTLEVAASVAGQVSRWKDDGPQIVCTNMPD